MKEKGSRIADEIMAEYKRKKKYEEKKKIELENQKKGKK